MQQAHINQEIIKNYRIICERESQNIENWLILGRCLVDMQQYEEAEKALTKIFEEGRFFCFKNGVPRLRISSLFHWRRNRSLFARAYADLSMISLHQGNLAEAERLLVMAMIVFEKEKNDFEYARAANRLGMVYRLVGAFESAEEAHYRAKELAKQHGWTFVLAETLGNLGMVYEGKDRFDLALEHHQEAFELFSQNEKYAFEAACLLRQIGLCLLRKGCYEESLTVFERAVKAFEDMGDLVFKSKILNDMTLVHKASGDMEQALNTARQAVQSAEESKDRLEMAANRLLYAGLKLDLDAFDPEIDTLLFSSLKSFKKRNKKAENANVSAMIGLMYLRRNELDKAESYFKDSIHIEEMLHRSLGMASDYSNLGLIARKKGQNQKAIEYWTKAAAFFENSGDSDSANYFKQQALLISGQQEVPCAPDRKKFLPVVK